MKLIPLYDETAPIACTISDDDKPERIAQIERMRANLARLERTEHGIRLHFPRQADVEADVRQFALDEKRCCQFWGFEVSTEGGNVALRWDGPPNAAELVDRVVAYLEGDAPITEIAGLL